MSYIRVDVRSRTPISTQLVDCVKELILQGMIKPDEQLPSVRILAAELAINPNTIQKAYVELERCGVLYSIPGRGSFACSDISAIADMQQEKIVCEIGEIVRRARVSGMSLERLIDVIGKEWNLQK